MRAFIFPGQGSQYSGMGEIILSKYNEGEEFIKRGEEVLEKDLHHLLFKADDNELKDTENAQISILLTSFLYFKFLEKNGIKPSYVCGHSLGEYSALLASDVLTFEDALLLVRERARVMKRFTGEIKGVQLAVLNLSLEKIESLIEKFQEKGVIQIAGYNSKSQVVFSMEESLQSDFKKEVESLKGKVLPLKTSLPFHSPLMKKAEDEFANVLNNTKFNSPKYLYISSVVNEVIQDGDEIKKVLLNQITKPVRWVQTIDKLIFFGIKEFYEVGPNKVLSNLGTRDYPDLKFISSESLIKEEAYERV